jgi:hypothetical protein
MDFLAKYYPEADIESVFPTHDNLPNNELAFGLWKNLSVARKFQDAVFLIIGRDLKKVRDGKLYKYLDFETFEQFVCSEELGFSREKAYLYIRIYELYVEKLELSPNLLQKVGVAKLMYLNAIVKDMEDKEEAIKTIERASDMRYNDFIKEVTQLRNPAGKPNCFWSEEVKKWIIQYHSDITHLVDLGEHGQTDQSISQDS